ncbi:uncharacterized protein N7469_004494 [Penicillium citrinum]|uniref:Uncharacterized protein n=2 Tax=Penicillium TaxID=5073 RepID=A0A9W9TQM1_PENCI|nr:uncharacterized protein N7469_004494 [Penicillium citrinum]KAJ5235326.1 hypothetical protein N7469_004494 [Penicillium citrinum]KAJ5590954.1 hypothetical protein N7450_004926 [Penicillium hetheringtonii]
MSTLAQDKRTHPGSRGSLPYAATSPIWNLNEPPGRDWVSKMTRETKSNGPQLMVREFLEASGISIPKGVALLAWSE